jgi:shikimate dehydrogenase
MMYAKQPTAFNRWAAEHGAARCIDGLGMLVEQAAEAFFVWRGVRPQSAAVLAELRSQLS